MAVRRDEVIILIRKLAPDLDIRKVIDHIQGTSCKDWELDNLIELLKAGFPFEEAWGLRQEHPITLEIFIWSRRQESLAIN